MTVPSLVQSTSGTYIATSSSGTPSLTSCVQDNLIVLHVIRGANTNDHSFSAYTNIERLDGTAGNITQQTNTISKDVGGKKHSLYWGRATANGTCSLQISTLTGGDAFAVLYEFSGVDEDVFPTNPTLTNVVEPTDQNWGTGTASTTIADAGTTTTGLDRLACQFIAIVGLNTTPSAFSGETGGDFTVRATAGTSSGSVFTSQLQAADMSYAGTVNGGTITISSADWGVFGQALIPAVTQTPPYINVTIS